MLIQHRDNGDKSHFEFGKTFLKFDGLVLFHQIPYLITSLSSSPVAYFTHSQFSILYFWDVHFPLSSVPFILFCDPLQEHGYANANSAILYLPQHRDESFRVFLNQFPSLLANHLQFYKGAQL